MSTLVAMREPGLHCLQCSDASSQIPGNFNYLVSLGAKKTVSAPYARKERSCPPILSAGRRSNFIANSTSVLQALSYIVNTSESFTNNAVRHILIACHWCDIHQWVTSHYCRDVKLALRKLYLLLVVSSVQMSRYGCPVQVWCFDCQSTRGTSVDVMPRRISGFEIGQSLTPRLGFELEMEEMGGYVASMGAAMNVCNISVWECEGRRPLQKGSSSRNNRIPPLYIGAGIAGSL
jgi:hypothetical protein